MKIKLHPIFALAWLGSQGAWANGSLDSFNSSLAPLSLAWAGDARLPNEKQAPPSDPKRKSPNYQQDALRDFLSLYQATREDLTARISAGNGTAAQKLLVQNALFRSEGQSLISKVLIGDPGKNNFANIRAVLSNLGIANGTAGGHQTHFHIYLKPPTRQGIVGAGQNLLAQESESEPEITLTGDTTMPAIADLPLPATLLNPPALVAKAKIEMRKWGNLRLSDEPGFKKVFTSCLDVEGYVNIDEQADVLAYLGYRDDPKTRVWSPAIDFDKDIKVTVLQQPKHGRVGNVQPGSGDYGYQLTARNPDGTASYQGWDKVVYQVEVKGQKFKVVFNLLSVPNADTIGGQICERTRLSMTDAPTGGLQDWLDSAGLSALLAQASGVDLNFANLDGSAVGITTGQGPTAQITLDTTASGHGWYIDPTPLDNTDDYLPTSNPNIWQAKAGSEADGKMDLLSVLLHEYGHALGLEHAADSADYMAATLQPGQRRLPSADELSLMSQLLAQLKASAGLADGSTPADPTTPTPPNPSAPLGAVLIGRLALGRRPEDDALANSSQALFSANPTLQGGSLATLQDWATQGKVVAESANTGNANTPAGATLAESTTSQTRLNQVFMLKPEDRFLSFTLRNLALDDAADGPDDAFEAALLGANTGADLLSPLALSHTDALLNLQAGQGGTGNLAAELVERAAQGVSHVTHADGSRTYLVDLSGITRDADGSVAVNLSFDLIGFGNTPQSMGSHVQVSDVRLLGAVQTVDDSASTAEDTAVAINLLATDVDSTGAILQFAIQTQPQHGSLVRSTSLRPVAA